MCEIRWIASRYKGPGLQMEAVICERGYYIFISQENENKEWRCEAWASTKEDLDAKIMDFPLGVDDPGSGDIERCISKVNTHILTSIEDADSELKGSRD